MSARPVLQSAMGAALLLLGFVAMGHGWATLGSALELLGPLLVVFAGFDVVMRRLKP